MMLMGSMEFGSHDSPVFINNWIGFLPPSNDTFLNQPTQSARWALPPFSEG